MWAEICFSVSEQPCPVLRLGTCYTLLPPAASSTMLNSHNGTDHGQLCSTFARTCVGVCDNCCVICDSEQPCEVPWPVLLWCDSPVEIRTRVWAHLCKVTSQVSDRAEVEPRPEAQVCDCHISSFLPPPGSLKAHV